MTNKSKHSFNASTKTKTYAKVLRHNETSAEALMWRIIRNRNLEGLKFRRQHPIDIFIADFYCHELQLVIELDGYIHELYEVKKNDIYREKTLASLGINILRFSNDDVFRNADFVANKILEFKKQYIRNHLDTRERILR